VPVSGNEAVLTGSRMEPRWPAGSRQVPSCEECGKEFENLMETRASKRFCSDRCRYRARDRMRDPDVERERSRRYYWANRERKLEQYAEYRAQHFEQRYCKCGRPTWSQKSRYCKSCSAAAATRRRFRKRVA
jgi:hypothetical protein